MSVYRMTDEEHARLKEASKPVPYLVFGGREPPTPLENATRVWAEIAARVGCHVHSIGPASTGDERDFEAIPEARGT